MSDPPSDDPRRRLLLIALNAIGGDRTAICRLAADAAWLRRDGRGRIELEGIGKPFRERLSEHLPNYEKLAERELDRARAASARILTRADGDYPEPLLDLPEPPPVLYCRGELPKAPAVAIVGSRQADAYGLETAESFARHLAAAGLTIVSGLARGIDSAAHRGALAAEGGRTVAVLGCGIDVTYPRGSARLADRIARAGAVVSEFPIGTAPYKQNFPMRNRIIAGLGLGTFVVRATARSGSLITARLALELGRDVYALPGNIFDPRSIGPNTLIRDGALPVQHPREILESLPVAVRKDLGWTSPRPKAEFAPPPEPHLKDVYDRLSIDEPRSAEELATATGRPVAEVLSVLLELELGDWVVRYPGAAFGRRG